MVLKSRSLVSLSEMVNNQKGIFFAVLIKREERQTKEGKTYYRAVFGDSARRVSALIWNDTPLFQECQTEWREGAVYKIEALFQITKFGQQIQISRIRETKEKDFENESPQRFLFPHAETDSSILLDELISIARSRLPKGSPLFNLICRIFKEYREAILKVPASRENHHTYQGGFLEHTLSVVKIAVSMSDHFSSAYRSARGRFSKDLVLAGAVLHEIGKVAEMDTASVTPKHTLEGDLIGYPVLGRDIIRKFAAESKLDSALQLQLEHIILTHPRFADWGTVKPPASLEALIVHEADYADSLFASSNRVLNGDAGDGPFTAALGPLGTQILKQMPGPPPADQAIQPERTEVTF